MTTFEFPDTTESRHFIARNTAFLPAFEALLQASNKCFARSAQFLNKAEFVTARLGNACRTDFLEVVFLATNGYAIGASKTMRSLYERAVTVAFIKQDSAKAERFLNFAAIQEHRALEGACQTCDEEQIKAVFRPPNSPAEIRARYEKVKPDFQMTACKKCGTTRTQPSWDIDFASMVQKVGGEYVRLYVGGYVRPNLLIHATPASALMEDSESESSLSQERSDADIALYSALCVFALLLRSQDEVFSLGLEATIDDCRRKILLWEDELHQNHSPGLTPRGR